jgi:urease subunit gamma
MNIARGKGAGRSSAVFRRTAKLPQGWQRIFLGILLQRNGTQDACTTWDRALTPVEAWLSRYYLQARMFRRTSLWYCACHVSVLLWRARYHWEVAMQLTPREFDKLIIHMMAEVALKRKAGGIRLNYPEAVAIISARALEGARAGKSIEEVTKDARTALTKDDVMDGVADLIPMVQVEAVFTDGSRLVTVHTPIQ